MNWSTSAHTSPRSIILAFTSSPQAARPPIPTKSLWFPQHLPFAETQEESKTGFSSTYRFRFLVYGLATRRGNSSHWIGHPCLGPYWTGRLGSRGRSLTVTVNDICVRTNQNPFVGPLLGRVSDG